MKPKAVFKSQHIVVAGAGYAGLPCALAFGPSLAKHRDKLRVTLINPEPRQELTCDIYHALRTGQSEYFPFKELTQKNGIEFLEGHVEEIDPSAKSLSVRGERREKIPYDHLVLATGLRSLIPGIDGLAEKVDSHGVGERRAFPFRTNSDAQKLRAALKRVGWAADARPPSFKDLFVVVMGAGATGLEAAGEIAAMRGRNPRLRVIIVDQMPDLLPEFSPVARRVLKQELSRLRIETILGSPAVKVTESEIHTEIGHVIPWDLMILCTGAHRNHRFLQIFEGQTSPNGLSVDGRFEIKGYPDHYAIGDLAHAPDLPKRAQFAVQEGRFIARLIRDRVLPPEHPPAHEGIYDPTDFGYLISLGPGTGIGRLGPGKETKLGRLLSPFVFGPVVNPGKRAIRQKYLLQLRTGL